MRNEILAKERWEKVPAALSKLGYKELRDAQIPCVDRLFGGEDTFCILPTSGGKTLIGLMPTLVNEWRTVIFSPLIALMKDQVDGLCKKRVRAGMLNSNQSDTENWQELKDWDDGLTQVLYVAPERIANLQFRNVMRQNPPDFVIVDEAHVMSKDAATFRPAYMACGDFIKDFKPKQVLALTATATKEIVDDVKRILDRPDMVIERHYTPRLNLKLSGSWHTNQTEVWNEVVKLLRKIKGSAIVYCATVRNVIGLTDYITRCGIEATFYHGQITQPAVKDANQDAFMSGRVRVMVATNAFGMGIDKADIEGIIHADPPSSVEAIAQETGRAARDGRDAVCHMFTHPDGLRLQQFFWNMENPTPTVLRILMARLKKYQDADGQVFKTVDELLEGIQDDSAEGAMSYLVSTGVVERTKPTTKVVQIAINEDEFDKLTPKQQALIAAVKDGGVEVDVTHAGNKVYNVDLAYLAAKTNVLPGTVSTTLKKLDKAGFITYVPPFTGKITKILRELTQEDMENAQKRRDHEWSKVCDARAYSTVADDKKQQFITEYFSREL